MGLKNSKPKEKVSSPIFKKNFYHQGIKYTFQWAQFHHQAYKRNDIKCSKALWKYLLNISTGNYNNKLFNDRTIKRISQFRLNHLKRGLVPQIGKKLTNAGVIKEFSRNNHLVKLAQNIHKTYESIPNKKVGHEEILSVILKNDENSIASEVPIWSTDTPEPITGHIDLVRIKDNKLNIVDYKPEGNFMRSIPQVSYYGLLLKKNFKKYYNHDFEVVCSSFNKDFIWIYEPQELLVKIKEILDDLDIKQFDWQLFM